MSAAGLSSQELTAAAAYPGAGETRRLPAGSLRFFRTIAESVGTQAPTAGVAINAAILAGLSGGGTALVLLVGAVGMGFVAYVPLPAAPFNWVALAAAITLAAGIVLPFAYPPLRRGIRNSPLLKVGASALLERPGAASDQ
jgi:hypothetical protein